MIYPNPRHLRAFVTIAETGSFGAAARKLHIGQPALSQALANLEQLVGVRLVERTTRTLALSAAGKEFLIDAQRVLQENERLIQHGEQWAQAQRGHISLLSIPSVAHRLLPSIMRVFSVTHPHVGVDVHDHADPILRQQIERGEGDLAIFTQTHREPKERTLPFLNDQFRFVCHAGHHLAGAEFVDHTQLTDERLILLRTGALFREFADAALRKVRLKYSPIEVDQPATLIGMVEAGLGVSLLPGLSCPPAALRTVVSLPFVKPGVSREIVFFHAGDREPMPAVEAFVKTALDLLHKNSKVLPLGVSVRTPGSMAIKRFFT